MLKFVSGLEFIDNILFKAQKVLIIIGVALMVVINGAQVFCRYVVHSSLAWSEQVSVLLFFILIMLGANLAVRTDTETRIDVLKFKKEKINVVLRGITDVISIGVLIIFILSSLAMLEQAKSFPQYLSSISLNYYYIYIWLVIGFGLVLFDKIINIVKKICVIMGLMTAGSIGMSDAGTEEAE